jgi:hypothetical protein
MNRDYFTHCELKNLGYKDLYFFNYNHNNTHKERPPTNPISQNSLSETISNSGVTDVWRTNRAVSSSTADPTISRRSSRRSSSRWLGANLRKVGVISWVNGRATTALVVHLAADISLWCGVEVVGLRRRLLPKAEMVNRSCKYCPISTGAVTFHDLYLYMYIRLYSSHPFNSL